MLEEVYKWIQNIAVYLVVVTAMLHAVPGKDYERYILFFFRSCIDRSYFYAGLKCVWHERNIRSNLQ